MPGVSVPSTGGSDDFVVLLARQRSGTNALRSVLKTHPEIHCFNEILNASHRHAERPVLRRQSYFRCLANHAGGDAEQFMPEQQETVFLGFLDHLRRLSRFPVKVVDVKYNTAHLIALPYQRLGTCGLLELIREREMRVLNLVRQNYLRPYLSLKRATVTGVFGARGDRAVEEPVVRIDVGELLWTLEQSRREDALVEHAFAGYTGYLKCEYSEVFAPEGAADPAALGRIASWLGVDPTFGVVPKTRKLTALPLWQAIENWDEVEAALRGPHLPIASTKSRSMPARGGRGVIPPPERPGSRSST